jgi:hypothetical protein
VDCSCHHLQFCKISDETNICVRCNKKEKIMSWNRSSQKNRYYLDIDLSFSCALYKYLLNLKICMLIEDGMDYSLVFLLIFS